MRLAVASVRDQLREALEREDVPRPDAELAACCLVDAELEGQGSHGLIRFPPLLERIRKGVIAARPRMVVEGAGALRRLDAGNALGQVAGVRAVDLAVELAREHGTGLVAVRGSNHLGALDFYVRRAAAKDLVALAFSNTPPAMAAPGTGTRYLGTNPIAAAFPTEGEPIVVDMGTSQAARGRVVEAQRAGRSIPEGWAIDAAGRSTTDPAAGLGGSMVPMGGEKGFALALLVELLAAALPDAAIGPQAGRSEGVPMGLGHAFWVIDPSAAAPGFAARAQGVVEDLHALGARVPGDRRREERARREAAGLEIPDHLRSELERTLGHPLKGAPR
ncbi:MAG: Ldh family oxidoreductase [Candidatus Dormibacteraceae bacterium]